MYRIFLFFFLSLPAFLSATHIVGGELSYRWISGTTYEVTLIVYRDDFNGSPQAPLDNPAVVSVFDENNNFIAAYNFALDYDEIIDPNTIITNSCLEVPWNVRTERGIYTDQITLPLAHNTTGYYFVYARCCRNDIVNNLLDSGDQGGTYASFVPALNTLGGIGNSSPTFDLPPPGFLCTGAPLTYDHTATDLNGDSLVYSLCAPYQGLVPSTPLISDASQVFPPLPPIYGPPFNDVVYQTPFSANDPLGGVPLQIGSQSGILVGTPNTEGTFVVGICVSEYRNGQLLNQTLRDFQYTVVECDAPTANIPVDPNTIDPVTGVGVFFTNCNDAIVQFDNNSSGAVSYSWDFGDPSTTTDVSTDFEPSYAYSDTGTYVVTLVATDADGCSDSMQTKVRIYPVFIPGFSVQDSCVSMAVQFTDLSTTTTGVVDSWTWDFGDPVSVADTSEDRNPSYLYSGPGTYTAQLTVTTDKGCLEVVTQQVVVHPLPDLWFTTNDLCEGDTTFFTNTSTIYSGSIDSYTWNLGNGDISTDVNPQTVYAPAGTYTVILSGTSDMNCHNTLLQDITVNPLPNVNLISDTLICPNTSVQLSASGGVSYAWSPPDFLNNINSSNPTSSPDTAITYHVLVIDANNCQNRDSVSIDLLPLPVIDAGEDTSVCLNPSPFSFRDSVQLQATGGASYSWSPATGLDNPNIADPIAKPSVNTVYMVEGTDANGCVGTDSIFVLVLDPAIDLIQIQTDSLCAGDTIEVSVIDQGDISTYSWTPPVFISDPTIQEPLFFPPNTTDYVLTVSNYCYIDDDTIRIEVLPIPPIDAGPIDSVCLGDPPYQLNGSPSNLDAYLWSTSDPTISDATIPNPLVTPASTSMYYLTGTDSIGSFVCTNTDSTQIMVYPLPEVVIAPPPGFICLGSSVQLNAVSATATQYVWDADPTLSPSNSPTPTVTPFDTTEYYVTAINVHGCEQRDSTIVNVQLPVQAQVAGDSIVCEGFSAALQASGGLYYQWSPDSILSASTTPSVYAHPNQTATVAVVVSNDCFYDTAYHDIQVVALPQVDAGEEITILRDESGLLTGSGAGSLLWYTPDQTFDGIISSPTSPSIEVSPLNTTPYVLEVTDVNTGCKNYDTTMVYVDVLTLLVLPTGFTPNVDGVNDMVHILKYLNIEELIDFSIYNRRGERVFYTNQLQTEGWDGAYKNLPQPVGVYTWFVQALTKDGDVINKKGNVTLIR